MGVLEILAEKLKDCKDLLKYVNKLSGVDKNREKLEKLAKVLDDFPDAKVLDELVKKLDLEDIDDFIADLVVNKQLRDLFKDKPELIESWRVLAGIDNLPVELRTNTQRLEDISNFIHGNPSKADVLKNELPIAANPEQYLDYVKYVGTELENFYKPFRLYGYLKNNRSWSWYINNLNSNENLKVGLEGYVGKTYEEVIEIVMQSGKYSNMNLKDAYMTFSYTTNYYYGTINNWIRLSQNPALRTEIVNSVVESLSKLPKFPSNYVFYRGIKLDNASDLQTFLNKYTTDAQITEDIFQSVAARTEDSFIGREGFNIEIEIRGKVGANSECRNVHDFAMGKYWNMPDAATSSEGVFLPGTTMKVIEAKPEENGIYKFILQEL